MDLNQKRRRYQNEETFKRGIGGCYGKGGEIKMFVNIDKQLEKIGFQKLHGEDEESEYGVYYARHDEHGFTQRLDIYHKKSGRHLIMSYQEGVNSDKFNNSVGLTYKEMKLAMKKYRQMKRRYGWE